MSLWNITFFHHAHKLDEKGIAPTSNYRTDHAFYIIRSRVYTLCLLLLALSMLFLFWDLGVPKKVFYIFTHPRFTVLTFGAICLILEILIGALLAAESLFCIRPLRAISETILPAICVVTSAATMAYTGVFLMSSIGIPIWNTWTLVALFISSSLSCGISLLFIVGYLVKSDETLLQASRLTGKCHLILLVFESIFIVLFLLAAFGNLSTSQSWELLFAPDMLSIAIVGICGLGIIVPALDEALSLVQKNRYPSPIANAMCLCGGFLLRFCIIMCGAYG